jgi:hypothetical protein
MSVQVGSFCFAAAVDAGPAACAAFSPVTSTAGDVVTTLSCSGSDPSGNLLIQRSVVTGQGVPVITNFTQALAYPPCVATDYLVAAEAVFGAALLAWALIWGLRKVLHVFNHLPVS